ncbi:MAG: DUF547 domain-containing protein [Methylococcaceae bacterium]|nr:DUF547 domain-containing protein [Methylococcaceae bacterium]
MSTRPEGEVWIRNRGFSGMLAGIVLLASACTTIVPRTGTPESQPSAFSHRDFNDVLKRFVDEQGLVDYRGLKQNPDRFEQYYRSISLYSPDSHPQLFKTEADRLAYWINAYNAAAIKIVLVHYPISGVDAVAPPFPLFFLPDKTGFFFFQRAIFGGVSTSLYYLENALIRERFREPRVHFALNCASRSCPRLPREAFDGENLDRQLDRETRKFFSEPRNFSMDIPLKRVYLSSILDWYRDDFIDWLADKFPDREPSLLTFVRLYLDDRRKAELDALTPDFTVEFVPYDWGLNERRQGEAHE